MEVSDHELAQQAAGGDEKAFHALIDRHAAGMFRAALSLTRNRADAEDVMQEAMIGAYRGIRNFAGRSSVKTWLMQILTRQAAKAWHRTRHARSTLSLHEPQTGQERDDTALTTRSASSGVDTKLDVMAALQKVSDAHREILVLREVRGLSYDEIAEVLNVPRGTVESRLSRARAELRRRLLGRDEDAGEEG